MGHPRGRLGYLRVLGEAYPIRAWAYRDPAPKNWSSGRVILSEKPPGRAATSLRQTTPSSDLDPGGRIEWPLDVPGPWIPPIDGPAKPPGLVRGGV